MICSKTLLIAVGVAVLMLAFVADNGVSAAPDPMPCDVKCTKCKPDKPHPKPEPEPPCKPDVPPPKPEPKPPCKPDVPPPKPEPKPPCKPDVPPPKTCPCDKLKKK